MTSDAWHPIYLLLDPKFPFFFMKMPYAKKSLVLSQRVHAGIWYILRAQRGSHIPTLRPKGIPYTYMDPETLKP